MFQINWNQYFCIKSFISEKNKFFLHVIRFSLFMKWILSPVRNSVIIVHVRSVFTFFLWYDEKREERTIIVGNYFKFLMFWYRLFSTTHSFFCSAQLICFWCWYNALFRNSSGFIRAGLSKVIYKIQIMKQWCKFFIKIEIK